MTYFVVFTDLDGSLLDGETYSFESATQALKALRMRNIPLILVSSKTRAEMEPLRRRLNHRDPFIVENGAAVFVPAIWRLEVVNALLVAERRKKIRPAKSNRFLQDLQQLATAGLADPACKGL